MKKHYINFLKQYLLIVCALFFIISCSDGILEEIPKDFLTPNNSFNTEEGVRQGIAGLHYEVRESFYNMKQFTTMLTYRGLGADIGYFGEDPGTNRYLVDYVTYLTPSSKEVTDNWDTGFRTIARANLLIESINNADEKKFIQETKNAYLAEARFFRAWSYRHLVSTYGDIPLLTEPVKAAKTDFKRDPVAEIHKLMVEDFKFGTENLPAPGSEASPGRVTQGVAWHYLAETYLEQKNHQLAVDAATRVVEDYNYGLMTERFGTRLDNDVFGAGDPFYDLYGYKNHNLSENTEAMWVIQIEPFITGGSQNGSGYIFGPSYFRLGNTPDGFPAILGTIYDGKYTGYNDTLSRPVATMRGTNYSYYDIWESDWNNDLRNAEHNIKRNFYYDNPASAYHNMKIDFSLYEPGTRNALRDTNQYIFPWHSKFGDACNYFEQPHRAGGGITHKDAYALRFAETLLVRAEAYLGINRPDLAANDINKIRLRSKAKPVQPENVTYDYILDEYARELWCEHWRHVILRRMGKLVERTKLYNNNPIFPGARIKEHNKLWPIPQTQIDLNIDAEFPQNPGY